MLGFSLFIYSISVGLAADSIPSLYHVVQTGAVTGYAYSQNDKDVFAQSHIYSIGIENTHLFYSPSSVQILLCGDISLMGLNQGVYIPSSSLILGYQIYGVFVGLGPRVMLPKITPDNTSMRTNIIIKSGYVFDMQGFSIPIQFGYVPDIEGREQWHLSVGFRKFLREEQK